MTEQDRLVAGRYRLGERVGSGAMGVVWRARDERLRRTVAVKQLLLQPGLDSARADEARQRAMREARIAARLQHANVVIVYDVAEDDGQPWLIMEYVPSKSLAAAIQDGPLPPYLVARVGAQAAAGLAAAHAVGVVHRDVKPGNVLLGDDGVVKIADFGISRAVDDVVLTATGLLTGTPAYLAPEMAKGEDPAPPSDVFALGSTLYAAVQGQPPFGLNENALALLRKVAEGRIRPPDRAGPLTDTLMNLLRTDPADRPTMREAHEELAALAAERTRPGGVPLTDPSRAWTTPGVAPVARPVEPPVASAMVPSAVPVEAPPPPPPPTRVSVPPPRRRGRARLAIAIVLVVLAVGTAVVLVEAAARGNHLASGPQSGAATTPATASTPATGDDNTPPTFIAMAALVRHYYTLLPGDLTDAYQLLSPNYQAAHPFDQFTAFYEGIRTVSAGQFKKTGPDTVDAVITFVRQDGETTHEPYGFTIVRRHGKLVIDQAVQLGRTDS